MFVAVAVLTQLQDLASTVLKTYTGEKLVLELPSKLFQQSQRLSLAYHDRVGTSDSTYRVQEDAKALQYIAVESLISLITAATTLAAMIYVTARIDLQLALVALAVTPPLLLAARHFRPRMRAHVARGEEARERRPVGRAGGADRPARREGVRPGGLASRTASSVARAPACGRGSACG